MILTESKSMFYSNYKAINVNKCENKYLKALGPLTKKIDAIKDVEAKKGMLLVICRSRKNKRLLQHKPTGLKEMRSV